MIHGAGIGAGAAKQRRWPRWGITLHISTGQSLSVGALDPVATTAQPYGNLRLVDSRGIFSGYVLTDPTNANLSLQPLVCPPQAYDSTDGATAFYPRNIGGPAGVSGETLDVWMANQRTRDARALTGNDYVIATGAVGASGRKLSAIQKASDGTANSYAASIFVAQAVTNLAKLAGKSCGCGPVILTHGESDADAATPLATYMAGLLQLQSDYENDLRAITGQSRRIPLLHSQMNSNPISGQGENTIATAQMLVAQQNRGRVVLSGPKYAYPGADGQHLSDYHPLAEKYAQILGILDDDGTWEPTWPVAIVRSGTTVVVTVHVPSGSLVFDGAHTGPHLSGGLSSWGPGKGFEAYDAVQIVSAGTGNGVSPIVLTVPTTANYTNGQTVYCNGHAGNTAANGAFTCTVVDGTHISLNGTTGNGTWTTNAFFGSPTIANVIGITGTPTLAQIGPHLWTVTFTLSRSPTTGLQIAYAHTPDAAYGSYTGGISGTAFPAGRCGLLRDSDPYVGISGAANYNWMCEFAQSVA